MISLLAKKFNGVKNLTSLNQVFYSFWLKLEINPENSDFFHFEHFNCATDYI